MTSAPARNCANVENAASISASVLACKRWICLPSGRAAASMSFTTTDSERLGLVGLMSRPMPAAAGTSSCNSSRLLIGISAVKV